LPTPVGEQHGHERCGECGGRRAAGSGRRNDLGDRRRVSDEPANCHQCEDRRDLHDHQRALNVAARSDTGPVDDREQRQCRDGDPLLGCERSGQLVEVAGEGHRDGSHAATLDHEQQRPAVEEGGERVKGVPDVRVDATDGRAQSRQLRVDERTDQRDHAPDDPRAEDERRGLDVSRHDVRVDEDPGTDDAPHHQHRRVERVEAAREPRVRGGSVVG
jgi:hypothetical protein